MERAGFSAARLARIGECVEGYIERGEIAGAVTLAWRHGETAWLDARGLADEASARPMQTDTLFRIASMTKPVTTVALLMLLEEGRVAFDDDIARWLPELASRRVLRDPAGALDNTEPARSPVTVLDLLTHRAGYAYSFTATGPLADAYVEALGGFDARSSTARWLAGVATLPLVFHPGSRFQYGIATDILGILIERIAGQSLGEFFKHRIFAPLGMRDTTFFVADSQLPRLATAYGIEAQTRRRLVDDHAASSRWADEGDPARFHRGGGGLVSTAEDYLQFARLLLGRGRVGDVRLLSHRSVDLMRSNFLARDQRRMPAMGYIHWGGQGFGLGLAIVDDPAQQLPLGYRSMGSFGWPGVYGTTWLADPLEDMIGILMIQLRPLEPFPMSVEFEKCLYDAIDD